MSGIVVAVMNASSVVAERDVKALVPVLQTQVRRDFAPVWGIDATVVYVKPRAEPPKGAWWLTVLDDAHQAGVLGFHEMTKEGLPMGKVYARTSLKSGGTWTSTASHELLEMLADPWINWCAQGSDGKVYALEVCDAVEADGLGYEIEGVLVSDFITPSWFEPTEADRVDFKQRIAKPLELASGGYISVLNASGGWTQVAARGEPAAIIPLGSRRQRRNLGKAQWRKSEQ